jgi:hypothetical protein
MTNTLQHYFFRINMFSQVGLAISGSLLACTSLDENKTTIKTGVYSQKEIRIENTPNGNPQTVRIIDGDSSIFLHTSYTDYSQESSGYNIGFTLSEAPDTTRYSNNGATKLIIGYGTGFAPNFADTVKSYDFTVIKNPGSYRINGTIGDLSVSGDFIPESTLSPN